MLPEAGPRAGEPGSQADAELRWRCSFVASLGHELQRQLSVIHGMSRLLLDAAADPEQAGVARSIVGRCEHMIGTLEDLVDLSRMEAGQVELQHEPFRVHGAIKGAVANLVFKAHAKGLRLRCTIDDDVPVVALGDAPKLRQIVANLVDNAIKYTDAGQVIVEVTLAADDAAGPIVRVAVSDSGPGIARAQREALFAFPDAAGQPPAGERVWSGMGLAICRDLVKIMGGDIGCDSEEGAGSTFWFRIRIGRVDPRAEGRQLAAPPRILLVCAHPERACQSLVSLHRHAFRVDLENDRARLREASRAGKHDLILLDDQQAEHYATFATWGASDGMKMVPVLGVPRSASRPDDIDETRLLDLVGRWAGRIVAG